MMPYVNFKSIKCYETTSGAGADDCAVYFMGERIFYSEMKGGRHRNINRLIPFEGYQTAWVKEVDSGGDEIIGTFTVSGNGQGELVAEMYGDDSHYDLWYDVGGAP